MQKINRKHFLWHPPPPVEVVEDVTFTAGQPGAFNLYGGQPGDPEVSGCYLMEQGICGYKRQILWALECAGTVLYGVKFWQSVGRSHSQRDWRYTETAGNRLSGSVYHSPFWLRNSDWGNNGSPECMTALAWQWAKGVSSPIIGATKAAIVS